LRGVISPKVRYVLTYSRLSFGGLHSAKGTKSPLAKVATIPILVNQSPVQRFRAFWVFTLCGPTDDVLYLIVVFNKKTIPAAAKFSSVAFFPRFNFPLIANAPLGPAEVLIMLEQRSRVSAVSRDNVCVTCRVQIRVKRILPRKLNSTSRGVYRASTTHLHEGASLLGVDVRQDGVAIAPKTPHSFCDCGYTTVCMHNIVTPYLPSLTRVLLLARWA
jgi:hypothetical protein